VRKARRAGAPFGGRKPGRSQGNPMARGLGRRKTAGIQGRKGRAGGGDALRSGRAEGEPERSESPGEHAPPSRTNPPGGNQGDGFSGGGKPLKRRCKAVRFRRKAQERKEERKLHLDHPRGEKALKGEAHERWRLKEASKGNGARRHVMRVAKP